MQTTDYHQEADSFLSRNGIKCRITLSNSKVAPWGEGENRNHYRVTLYKGAVHPDNKRLAFDFWGSINDAEKLQQAQGNLSRARAMEWTRHEIEVLEKNVSDCHPVAYDILACISADVNCPDTFKDFCADCGYESDSIKALQTFRRRSAFSKRLKAFFTPSEIEELSEIQ